MEQNKVLSLSFQGRTQHVGAESTKPLGRAWALIIPTRKKPHGSVHGVYPPWASGKDPAPPGLSLDCLGRLRKPLPCALSPWPPYSWGLCFFCISLLWLGRSFVSACCDLKLVTPAPRCSVLCRRVAAVWLGRGKVLCLDSEPGMSFLVQPLCLLLAKGPVFLRATPGYLQRLPQLFAWCLPSFIQRLSMKKV